MCTAISYNNGDHYFGRNLDLEYHFQEQVVITPRNYPLGFRHMPEQKQHYAMVGMATVDCNYPLYYEATNEWGLSAAGLNFPGFAEYQPIKKACYNLAPFEIIPWLLCQCKTAAEAKELAKQLNIAKIPYSEDFPLTPLHYIIADKNDCIVLEPTKEGLEIFENPIGVLTNSPGFAYQQWNLNNYLNLTNRWPENRFSDKVSLKPYSAGMGGLGMPGDLSSVSRFVRAAFTKLNSVADKNETSSVSQFFHILGAVAQQNGCVEVNEKFEKTLYSCCCNTDKGIYYYTTYDNHQITAVSLNAENLDTTELFVYPLVLTEQIRKENF